MNSATQGMFLILSAILFIMGLSDLAEQYKSGEELRWIYPIILIGFGAGIPIVIIPLAEYLGEPESDHSDGDYLSSYDHDSSSDGGGD